MRIKRTLESCAQTKGRWFFSEATPAPELDPLHIGHRCEGKEKVHRAVRTLNRIAGVTFCVAFDQMEDTYESYHLEASTDELFERLSLVLRLLSHEPGLVLVFAGQTAFWTQFVAHAKQHLIDRMTEGSEARDLARLLAPEHAVEIVAQRMRHFAWNRLRQEPPEAQPCFPFTNAEVMDLWSQAEGKELRDFLQLVREKYAHLLGLASDTPNAQVYLTRIQPDSVLWHERHPIVLQGDNIPSEAEVFFGDRRAGNVQCRPDSNEIEVTNPPGDPGPVTVRVVDGEGNEATIDFTYLERELPTPYYEYIDCHKLRSTRKVLGLSQKEVADRIRKSQSYVSQLERGRNKPDDETFERVAEIYDRPLREFFDSSC